MGDKALTYAALSQRSNQLAHLLREQGIREHDRVGVFLNKSLETMIAIYGILKAGGAYVPLDPQSPSTRLADIIQDCGIRGIITQPNKRAVLADAGTQQDVLQFAVGAAASDAHDLPIRTYTWDDVAQLPTTLPNVRLMEHDLAYVMYTSGSTGKPKGMMHTHYSGASYVRMSAATYGVTSEDRLSNHSPLHFDMSTFDYLTGPASGATTIIIPEAYKLFPVNLAQLIEKERISIWYSVPFALIQLLLRGALEQRDLTSLRWVLYGGEPFPLEHLRALIERLPGTRFSNVYGPAEVNQCTYYHIPPPAEWADDNSPVPIGYLCQNVEARILAADDALAVDGEIGELAIRSGTMMRGYWNRPDLNAKAFYRVSVAPGLEKVFYRTGDLAKQDDDGVYHYFGRKDRQVKIRGYRVELAEVEHALTTHELVEEGATYAVKSDDGDHVGAAVILRGGAELTQADLIAYLRGRVPPYAVPDTIRFMDAFPRTGTGKIDRRALQQEAQRTPAI